MGVTDKRVLRNQHFLQLHVSILPTFAQQIHSFVRFVNLTVRKVDIVWLNYEGARVRYKTLKPEQFVDVNTFVGHPWIFRDADTGDKLMVQLQEVFEPIGYNINEGWPPQRRIVKISIPGRQNVGNTYVQEGDCGDGRMSTFLPE